jgi:hypothetical protein
MRTKSKWINRVLTFYNGPINDETVNKSTAASTAIANYGVTQLKNGTSEGTWMLEAPVLGVQKVITVSNTTKIFHIKTLSATINNSTDDVLTVTPSTKMKELGVGFKFYGASTAQWYMVNDVGNINSSQVTITLTSTT